MLQYLFLLLTLGVGGMYLRQRKATGILAKQGRIVLTLLMLAGALGACLGAAGCGSGAADAGLLTPAGTQNITITFTGTGSVTHSQDFTFKVVSK